MLTYIVRRLLTAPLVLLLITIVSFLFIELAPGDAVAAMLLAGEGASLGNIGKEHVERLREIHGFNKPAPIRYLLWLRDLARGNLGYRFKDRKPVATILAQRIPLTLELMGVGLLVASVFGISLGVISALKQNSLLDYVLVVFAFGGVSVPTFFIAMVALFVFGLSLDWLPIGGSRTPAVPFSLNDHLRHLIMPALVFSVTNVGDIMRYARAGMVEVMRQDYVTTARAKGLSEKTVIARHVFRNALLPLVTVIGLKLPWMFGGAAILETVFQWPGLGMLFIEAAVARDYFIIMAQLVVYGVAVLLFNLLADIMYAVVDPRIRYE